MQKLPQEELRQRYTLTFGPVGMRTLRSFSQIAVPLRRNPRHPQLPGTQGGLTGAYVSEPSEVKMRYQGEPQGRSNCVED